MNRAVLVRLAVFQLVCAPLFGVSRTASSYFLPERVLQGRLPASRLPVETSQLTTTFLRIFAINVLLACTLVVVASLFRVGEMPLGYLVVMGHSVIYGILLGTSSFGIPAPARFAPSLTTVLVAAELLRSAPTSLSPPARKALSSCANDLGETGAANGWDRGGAAEPVGDSRGHRSSLLAGGGQLPGGIADTAATSLSRS